MSLTAGDLRVPKEKPVSHVKKNDACRYCGSKKLVKFLSLGKQPPSNSFLRSDQVASENRYPLEAYWCEACFLVQLLDVVPAEAIFNNYFYAASSSKALKAHYARLAESLTARFNVKAGEVVVDIGCNDGILLHGYSKSGIVRVGVEPSQLGETAKTSGLQVVRAFFGPATADSIVQHYGQARIVTATNVFAHVDNIAEFVSGLPRLLRNDGVFVIESPYLINLIDEVLFDTIYHEHLCYLSLTPLVPFLKRFGLDLFDVERIPFGASGPAIRVFVRRENASLPIQDSVVRMLEMEAAWGIGKITPYQHYAKKVEEVKTRVLDLVKTLKRSAAHIGGYGAPAKGNTLLNYFDLTSDVIEYIAETNTLKQGFLTPGAHIPIISEEEFVKRMPDYALLLSWNYLDFFLENSDYIRRGGRFLVPLPTPQIVP